MTPEDVKRQVNEATDQLIISIGAVMEKDGERLAVLEVEIRHLREDQVGTKTALDEVRRELRKINDTMSEARGGWKAIAIISGVSASIGAALTKLVPFLLGAPR